MLQFSALFSRVEETILQNILGDSAIRILNLLSETGANNQNLKNIVVEMYGPYFLLRDKKIRNELIDLLKTDEVRQLYKTIEPNTNIDSWPNAKIYQALNNKNIAKGSVTEERLFEFFGLTVVPDTRPEEVFDGKVLPEYPLFEHQRIAVKKIKQILNIEPYRVLLHMPTGSGKTRTAMNIIVDHMREREPCVVVWLANSEELCEQAFQEARKAWKTLGNRHIGIYRFWGIHGLDLGDEQTKDCIIISSLAKLYSKICQGEIAFISKIGSRASLVVMDEAHQAIAPTYHLVMDSLSSMGLENKLLGLSATPGRTWNNITADQELANIFARRKVKLEVAGYKNPVDYLVEQGYLASVRYKPLEYTSESEERFDLGDMLDIPDAVLKRLGKDEQRNILILRHTELLIKRGHNRILVFAPSVECSNLLAVILRARGYKAFSVTGATPSEERNKFINEYKHTSDSPCILCNFGVLTTGFDAPKTSAAVIARPTYSLVLFSQMVGRAIRGVKAGGNKQAEIVTLVDTFLPGFESVANSFENWEDVWE
ncbi:MAG TPA: restriction endonuclease [Clostridiales bacterium]|nr:restriction endonuclease [Clostridiales bacterium]